MLAKYRKSVVIGLILVALSIGGGLGWYAMKAQAQPPGAAPDGSIAIPTDLMSQYDQAIKAIKEAQVAFDQEKPKLEQVLRLTLDRAGVAPSQFNQYSLNPDKKLLEKRPVNAQNPIQ